MNEYDDFLGSVVKQLRAIRHCDLKRVGTESGVPESTLRKLYYGEVTNPRVNTVQALHDYFADQTKDTNTGNAKDTAGHR